MDNKDGGLRAIKIVNKPADNNEAVLKELRQEMELMNVIGAHEHVLRLYEYSEDESHVYFVLGAGLEHDRVSVVLPEGCCAPPSQSTAVVAT